MIAHYKTVRLILRNVVVIFDKSVVKHYSAQTLLLHQCRISILGLSSSLPRVKRNGRRGRIGWMGAWEHELYDCYKIINNHGNVS